MDRLIEKRNGLRNVVQNLSCAIEALEDLTRKDFLFERDYDSCIHAQVELNLLLSTVRRQYDCILSAIVGSDKSDYFIKSPVRR